MFEKKDFLRTKFWSCGDIGTAESISNLNISANLRPNPKNLQDFIHGLMKKTFFKVENLQNELSIVWLLVSLEGPREKPALTPATLNIPG